LIFLACFGSMSLSSAKPLVVDDNLQIGIVFKGNFKPTSFALLDQNNILVLDRDEGKVYLVTNDKLNPLPLLDVNVATVGYRGMLGISTMKSVNGVTNVFLYYTEASNKDGEDEPKNGGDSPLGNRLYRYNLIDNKLINPHLMLSLPAYPGPRHMGGAVITGPDNNIYFTVGDLDGSFKIPFETMAQNYQNGSAPDGRSGIIRVSENGHPVGKGILAENFPLNLYYAYGIRNSFGIDFDPLTGYLWDTENGPHYGDEINLVEPGFNSGWAKVQGLWKPNLDDMGTPFTEIDTLVNFEGKGKYSKPKFIWIPPVAPTAIKFLNSEKLGAIYANDIFVGAANYGNLYHFVLNKDRDSLELNAQLTDKIANDVTELNDIIFAKGFGRITDIEVGPDGFLYVLSAEDDGATLYKISSK
jgi:glucose/arabinose dehydrogenase